MNVSHKLWLQSLTQQAASMLAGKSKSARGSARRARRIAMIEPLEGRVLMSTTTVLVNNMSDITIGGQTDLRQALAAATGGDYIIDVPSGNIPLGQGVLVANDSGHNLTIQNADGGVTTIDGGEVSTVLKVDSGTNVTLSGFTITHGVGTQGLFEESGGGIENEGVLVVDNSTIVGNSGYFGAGIENSSGTLTLENSLVTGNNGGYGVGIGSENGTLAVINSTISGNTSGFAAGGIYIDGGTAVVTDSTISGNEDGGLFNLSAGTTIDGTIITGNSGTGDVGNANGAIVGSNDLISDGSGSDTGLTNLHSGPALLAPLGNYGGSTETMPPLPGSPALGNGQTFTAADGVDQRGVARSPFAPTIGAFESLGFVVTTTGGSGTQRAAPGSTFKPLAINVAPNEIGDPVAGGVVTYTAPPLFVASSFLNSTTATLDPSGNAASVLATADEIAGTYSVTASAGLGANTNATFTLTNVSPPAAVNDSYIDLKDTTLTVPADGVLTNDTDAGPITAVPLSSPTNGSVVLAPDGSFVYTPNAGFSGIDSFTYAANDGTTNGNTATVSIAVNPYTFAYAGPNGAEVVNENGGKDSFTVTNNGFGLLQWSTDGGNTFSTQWGDSPLDTLSASSAASITINLGGDNSAIIDGASANFFSSASAVVTTLNVNAAAGNTADTLTIDDSTSPAGPGIYTYNGQARTTTGPLGGINVVEGGIPFRGGTTLIGSDAGNTFNVLSSKVGETVTIASTNIPAGSPAIAGNNALPNLNVGTNTVNVGTGGSLASIGAAVIVTDNATLNIDDHNDTSSPVATLDSLSGYPSAPNEVTGLSAASIVYGASVMAVNIDGGTYEGNGVTFNVNSTQIGTTTTIAGGPSQNFFNLSNPSETGGLDNLPGAVVIQGGSQGDDVVTLDDSSAISSESYVITPTTVGRAGFGGLTYVGNIRTLTLNSADNGENTTNVNGTADYITTTINGQGVDTININNTGAFGTLNATVGTDAGSIINVLANDETLNLTLNSPGTDAINIGSTGGDGTMAAIGAPIDIVDQSGLFTLNFNDQNDTTSQTWTLESDDTNGNQGLATVALGNSIGMTIYRPGELASMTISGGSGSNTFNVDSTTGYVPTTLNTGIGNDSVHVFGTGNNTLDINGQSGQDTVTLGGAALASIGMQNLDGTINLGNEFGSSTLILDDSEDSNGQTGTLADNGETGSVTGLSPAIINFTDPQTDALNILGGSGGNNFSINGDGASGVTTLDTGTGSGNTVNVAATPIGGTLNITGAGSNNTVTIGLAGSVAGILSAVNVDGAAGSTHLVFDSSNDATSNSMYLISGGTTSTLSESLDTQLTQPTQFVAINYATASLSSLTVDANGANDQSLNVNFSGGNPIPAASPRGLSFNAGAPAPGVSHALVLSGNLPTGAFASEIHNANDPAVPSSPGQHGTILFDDGTQSATAQTGIRYSGLQAGTRLVGNGPDEAGLPQNVPAILDFTPVVNYTFNDFAADNSFSAFNGLKLGFGSIEFQNTPAAGPPTFASTAVSNKTNIAFHTTQSGSMSGNVNITTPSNGLASLQFNTPPDSQNNVTFTNTPQGVATSLVGGSNQQATTVIGTGVTFETTLSLNSPAGVHTLTYDAGGLTPSVSAGILPGEVIISLPGFGSVDATGYQNIAIINVAPVAIIPGSAPALTGAEGVSLTNAVVGTFMLPLAPIGTAPRGLPASDFTATIDWGDPSVDSTAGTIIQDAVNPNLYDITGTHTFTGSGAFAVANTVAFSGASYSSTINGVSVSVALSSAGLTAGNIAIASVNQGNMSVAVLPIVGIAGATIASGPIATVTLASGSDPVSNFSGGVYIINSAGTVVYSGPAGITQTGAGQYTVNAQAFSLPKEGTYQVVVTVTDAAPTSGQNLVAAPAINITPAQTVSAVGLAVIADAPLSSERGAELASNTGIALAGTTVGGFTDADPTSLPTDFTAVINWGDGSNSAGTISQPGGTGTSFNVIGSHTFATPGNYSTQINVTDAGGSRTTLNGTASVTDLPVTGSTRNLTAVAGQNAGQFVLAMFEDPNTLATVSDVNAQLAIGGWGDTTPINAAVPLVVQQTGVDPSNGNPIFQVLGSHAYTHDTPAGLPYTLSVIITTVGGTTTTLTSPPGGGVTVTDAPLTGSAGNQMTGIEGNSTGTVLLGTFVDGNPNATSADYTTGSGSVVVNWGDGSAPQTLDASNLVPISTTNGVTWTINAAHTYSDPGTYVYTVAVNEDGGAATLVSGAAVIADAPLTAGLPTSLASSTGIALPSATTVGSFSDGNPNALATDFTATIQWGDGSSSAGTISPGISFRSVGTILQNNDVLGSSFVVSGSHIYTVPGNYTTQIIVTDVGGSTTILHGTSSVTDLPVTGAVANFSAVEGMPTGPIVLGTFSSPNPFATASSFTATLANWGDGSPGGPVTLTITPIGGTAMSTLFAISGNHTYSDVGMFPVSISVATSGGVTAALISGMAIVADAPLSPTHVDPITAVQAAPPAVFTVANFTDANPGATEKDFTATVTATSSTGQIITSDNVNVTQQSDGTFAVTATLGFPEIGAWTIATAVSDIGGSRTLVSTTASVSDAPLIPFPGVDLTPSTGIALSNTPVGVFADTDPQGQLSDFTAVIDWGDGTQSAGTISRSISTISQSAGTISRPAGTTIIGDTFVVSGSHAYATPGNYTTQISVTDVSGSTTTLHGTASVTDVSVSGAVNNFAATEGLPTGTVVLATFSDPNPLATAASVTATLAANGWGDGSTDGPIALTIVPIGGTANSTLFAVTGSHTYAEEGSFPVNISVTTSGGVTTLLISGIATVADAPLAPSPVSPITAIQWAPPTVFTVANFIDANPGATATDFTAAVTATSSTGQIITGDNITITQQAGGIFTVSAMLGFPDMGAWTIATAITDIGGSQTQVSTTASVSDAPLIAGPASNLTPNTGIALANTLVGGFLDTDPNGQSNQFTAVIDWGDGSRSVGTISGSGITLPIGGTSQYNDGPIGNSFAVSGSHTYTVPGNYTTQISVTDIGGATTVLHGTAGVTDLAVTGAVGNFAAVEGFPTGTVVLGTFSSPNPFATASSFAATLGINGWGDGTPDGPATLTITPIGGTANSTLFAISGNHTYTDEGLFPVNIYVTTSGGVTTTLDTGSATVADAPLSPAQVNPVSAVQSAPPATFTVAKFTDANPGATAEDFSAFVTATSSTGRIITTEDVNITEQAGGIFAVTATLGFPEMGAWTIATTITDVGGSQTLVSTTASVADAPLVNGYGPEISADTGIAIGKQDLGGFVDTNSEARSSNFTAVIQWGDGSVTAGTIYEEEGDNTEIGGKGGAFFVVDGTHAYATPGHYNVQISVVDVGGSSVSDVGGSTITLRGTAYVSDLPVSGAVSNFTAVEGTNTGNVVLATFSDPNPLATASSLRATLGAGGWGDGSDGPSTLTITAIGGTSKSTLFAISGNHTYAETGSFTVNISVTTSGRVTTNLESGTATIADASLSPGLGNPIAAIEGAAPVNFTVATFSDGNPQASTSDFTATVTATSATGQIVTGTDVTFTHLTNGSFAVSTNLSFPDKGVWSVSTLVTDVDGSQALVGTTAFVGIIPLTISLGSPFLTYNGSPQGATAVTTPVGIPVTFTYDGTSVVPTHPGVYAVIAVSADPDYAGVARESLVIARAIPTISITAPSATYNGALHGATSKVTGVIGGSLPGSDTLTYFVGTGTSGTLLSGAPTDAGTYTVLATYAGTSDYTPLTQTATYTIAPATPILSLAAPASPTYDGTPKAATASVTGVPSAAIPLAATFLYYAGSSVSGTPLLGAPTEAGTYTVLATHAAETDYVLVRQTATYTIGVAMPTVTITAPNVLYNGAPQPGSSTVTGMIGGANPGVATLTYFAGTNTTGTPLPGAPTVGGTYTVRATYPGSADYAPVVTTSIFTINGNPTVAPITATNLPGSNVYLSPLSTAASVDGGTLSFSVLTAPALGSVSIVTVGGTQEFLYHPGPGAFTGDSFTYKVTDSFGGSSTETATVNYAGVGLVASSLNPGKMDLVVIGTSGNHTIAFANAKARKLRVTIDGTVQGLYAVTGRVFAFAQQGSDVINASRTSRSVWVYGGTGNNTFIGGSGSDVFIGGTGNDTATGRGGRNLLIGGGGTNTLNGRQGTDLVVAGTTVYDAPTLANQASIQQLVAIWQKTKNSPKLIAAASAGLGGSGTPALNKSTIITADVGDILIGNTRSWFFGEFAYTGGTDVFNDGRHIKPNHFLTPLKNERVTLI